MQRASFAFAMVAWLSSCASEPTARNGAAAASTQAWLAPFAEALQFVPPGMQSHWLRVGEAEAAGDDPARRWLEVRAGRDFDPNPTELGPYVGVHVLDAGPGGITLTELKVTDGERRAPFGATPVWCTSETRHGRDGVAVACPTWSALVDERFLVNASSEALLHTALARSHAPQFASLEPLPSVPPDTVALVLRSGPGAILACASSPPRVLAWAQDERELRNLVPAERSTPLPGPQGFAAVQCEVASTQFAPLCWVFFGAMSAR